MEDLGQRDHKEGDTPYLSLRESQENTESGDNPDDGDQIGIALADRLASMPTGRRREPIEDDESDLGAMGPNPDEGNREVDQIRRVLHEVMNSVGLLMTERQEARRERSKSRETARKVSPARPEPVTVNPDRSHLPLRGWHPDREPMDLGHNNNNPSPRGEPPGREPGGPSGPPDPRDSGSRGNLPGGGAEPPPWGELPGQQPWEPQPRSLGASRSRSREHFGSQRKPRIPRNYTGKDESWEDYLKHFQGVALWNRWEPEDQTEGLYIALQGSAANYVYNQPGSEVAPFGELCAILDNRYGAAKSAAMDKRKLKE